VRFKAGLKVTRLSDERICKGREFQLLGEDTQNAREAKDDLTQDYSWFEKKSGFRF